MKRLFFALGLAVTTGVLAHTIYRAAKPVRSGSACSMAWLARELDLTPAQQDAVLAIHLKRCAEIQRLGEAAVCAAHQSPTAQGACREATAALIAEVSAQLDRSQRAEYLSLVRPCLAAPQPLP